MGPMEGTADVGQRATRKARVWEGGIGKRLSFVSSMHLRRGRKGLRIWRMREENNDKELPVRKRKT